MLCTPHDPALPVIATRGAPAPTLPRWRRFAELAALVDMQHYVVTLQGLDAGGGRP